jgi:hypothetical protein
MKQLYISCVRPIFEYASPVWYHKLTGQWKDEIQKVQNTALRKILGAFRSAPVKAMQRDAEILPVNIQMKEIRGRFVVRAIRAVSPRNSVWKLANRNKPAEGDLECALTPLPCQSHRNKCFEIHVFFLCHFVL